MSRFIQIKDEHSKILGRRFLNSQLSLYIGIGQLIICLWALTQHVYSIIVFDRILFCDFSDNSTLPTGLTGVDAIIFDIGLFHSLWGISGCVAQHLDGGYGRFAWCVSHTLALVVCLPCAFMNRPKPFFMWPLLIQQSAYGIGLLILSLAALPRILPTFMGKLDNAPILAIFAYISGTLMNFFLLFVYWHWYWHVESCFDSVKKIQTNRFQDQNSRRSTTSTLRRPPIETAAPNKILNIGNGVHETRTPLITNVEAEITQPNGNLSTIEEKPTELPKQNGSILPNGNTNGHPVCVKRSLDAYTTTPINSRLTTLLVDTANKDNQTAIRRQSLLLDELSPIESSGSSVGSSSTQQHRRRLPTIGTVVPHQKFTKRRSPFIESQSSTLSLPINGQPISGRSGKNDFMIRPNGTPNFRQDDRRGLSSAREMREPPFWEPSNEYIKPEEYTKNRVGHRASLQQQQQIIEPHLRQMRRYQSHISNMSPSSPIRCAPIHKPPSPAPSTPPSASLSFQNVPMGFPTMNFQQPTSSPRGQLRTMRSELPLRMAQYNCMQQQLDSGEEIEYPHNAPSPRSQRFYSAAL